MNNTPSKIMAIDIAEQHRSFFNLKAFGINNDGQVVDESKVSKLNSKGLTSEKWERILSVLTHWKDIESVGRDEARIQKEYRKTHSSEWKKDRADFHRWKMIYAVELGQLQNGNTVRRLVRREDDRNPSERCLVIPMLEVFDVIYESHSIKLGHLGEERTYTDVAKKYYSVSQAMVRIFIKGCLQCNLTLTHIATQQGCCHSSTEIDKKPPHSKQHHQAT